MTRAGTELEASDVAEAKQPGNEAAGLHRDGLDLRRMITGTSVRLL